MAKYIKVTPKGDTRSHIVLATLRDFYTSQGAKIEEPTGDEIYAAVPTEQPARTAAPTADIARLQEAFAKEKAVIEKQIAELREALDKANAELAEKNAQIAAQETTIAEAEKVIEQLRKQTTKATKAAE